MDIHALAALYSRELFGGLAPDDFSNNGIQVEASTDITRAVFAVDACLASITKAAEAGAQLLITHHGISWGSGFRRLDGYTSKRLAALYKNNLSLYAMHLPLDMHPVVGNNAVLAKMLNLTDIQPFFRYHGEAIGTMGKLPAPMSSHDLADILDQQLNTHTAFILDNNRPISSLGIVSGAGDDAVFECAECGLDCLLTGEFSLKFYHPGLELGLTVLASGHYATETTGIRKLMEWTQEHTSIECQFIDIPTGL